MCNVDISRTIPTTLFLKTKYLKYHKISFKFRAITNLSCVPLNPWLIPRINILKSNLYCNGFIVIKLIYWSEHTHNRLGWRPKSYSLASSEYVSSLKFIKSSVLRYHTHKSLFLFSRYINVNPRSAVACRRGLWTRDAGACLTRLGTRRAVTCLEISRDEHAICCPLVTNQWSYLKFT